MCMEGDNGYSNRRQEVLIDLLLRKQPQLDEQVHYTDATGLRGCALCGLCLVSPTALR